MLEMADHEGDPLGNATLEPESSPVGPTAAGPELPAMPVDPTFGTPVDPDGASSIANRQAGQLAAAFAGRQRDRADRVRREGGTTASERAVELGLGWLTRHQRDDGGWSLDVSKQCRERPGCSEEPQANSDAAATGLALLAFLGAGHSPNQSGPHRQQVARGGRVAPRPAEKDRRAVPRRHGKFTDVQPCHRQHGALRGLRDHQGSQARAAGPGGGQLHRPRAEQDRRRLAVLARDEGRHVGLRLADVRAPERRDVRPGRLEERDQRLPQVPRPCGGRQGPDDLCLRAGRRGRRP